MRRSIFSEYLVESYLIFVKVLSFASFVLHQQKLEIFNLDNKNENGESFFFQQYSIKD